MMHRSMTYHLAGSKGRLLGRRHPPEGSGWGGGADGGEGADGGAGGGGCGCGGCGHRAGTRAVAVAAPPC